MAAAIGIGLLLGWVLAVLAIRYRVDQIIIGVVINIFVLGLTSFLTARILAPNPHLNSGIKLDSWRIPGLGDIPIIGPIFFDQTIFVYASLILVAVLAYALFHTRWGLQARAVGEHPRAADTVGINVYRYRYLNVLLGGRGGRLRRRLLHHRHRGPLRREHDHRPRLHRPGGHDLRALAPGGGAVGGPHLRLRRCPGREAGDPPDRHSRPSSC